MAAYDSFLMTHYRWIESYCRAVGDPPTNGKLENYQRVLTDFPHSFAVDMVGGNHNILEVLGNKAWHKNAKGVLTRKNLSLMDRGEYPDLLSSPESFIRQTLLPRLYDRPLTGVLLREKAQEYYRSIEEDREIHKALADLGFPVRSYLIIGAPLDLLADFMRGTKGLLVDLHSTPEWVSASCQVLLELVVRQARAIHQHCGTKDMLLPLHLPTLLSRRDYEAFYHPTYEKLLVRLLEEGYRVLVLVEGNVDRFIDLLAEVDSPNLILHFENSRLDLCLEQFRNKSTQITGFYPTQLLQYGSLEECLQEVRRLKKALKDVPNYIFSTNKVLLGSEDGDVERIRRVYEAFVRED